MSAQARAQLVKLEIDALFYEARRTDDVERRDAIIAEVDGLLDSLREIAREQLIAQITRSDRVPARRRWLRRLRNGRAASGGEA